MKEFSQFSESAKINQDFRKEIRRKDIDRRLAERRKILLEHQKNVINQPIIDAEKIKASIFQIFNTYQQNGNKLYLNQLKQLAQISCSLAGSQAILSLSKQFFEYIVNTFIMDENKNDTHELDFTLLIFNNCLTVSSPNNNMEHNSVFTITSISISQRFIQRIFDISLQSQKNSIRQYSMSIIFDLVYNNDANFVHNLIINPSHAVVGLLFNQMQNQPNKTIVIQTLRCFCLIMRKVNFAPYDQFGRMRKCINMVIKNSNSLDLVIIGVICLQSLLRCLPNQRVLFCKAGMLPSLLQQTLTLRNNKLALHTLRTIGFLLQNKSQQQCKLIVSFIEQGLENFNEIEVELYSYKILYDIIVNNLYQVDSLLQVNKKLLNKTMESFESNTTDKKIMVEISFCLAVIAAKSKQIQKSLVDKIRMRIKQIVDNWDLNEESVAFLEQSLNMLGINSSMEE